MDADGEFLAWLAQNKADAEACEREGHPEFDTAESPTGSWRYVRYCTRCGEQGDVVRTVIT